MYKFKLSHFIPPTLLLAISGLLSRVLGVVRDGLLARTFGATAGEGIYDLDVYYAAFRIPDVIYSLLVFGVISAAFIPIFTQYKKEKDFKNGWVFASSVLHLMFLGILALSAIIFIFAPYLAPLIAGGFNDSQLELLTLLMRILLLSPILFSITAVLVSIQDSFKTFFWRSLGPLFYNLGIVVGILYFSSEFGVIGVTWGVILGALLQLIVQLPSLFLVKYQHKWILGYQRTDVRKAFWLVIPRILGLSLTQLTLLANTLIASFLATGSITIFYFADNLQAVPLGMIGIAFAITSFATLSELASEPTKAPFAKEIKKVLHQILFLVIPATVGLIILRNEVINVILLAGKFQESDAQLTAQVLMFLAISLFAQSLIPLLARGFYAFHDSKTPLWSAVAGSLISIGGSLLLGLHLEWGIVGIAMAYSLGMIVNFMFLLLWMGQKLKASLLEKLSLLKMVMAATIMGLVVFALKDQFGLESHLMIRILALGAYTLAGVVSYFLISWILKLPQLKMLKFLKRR